MILGDFNFNLRTMTPNTITRSTDYNWSDAEKIGDLPNLQNLGISRDQIEIEGVFYPKFNMISNYRSLADIRASDLCRMANNLINDSGEILGKFVITSVKETQSYFDEKGRPQKIEFTLSLKRSPESISSATWNNSSDSVINTTTNIARSYLRW